MFQRKKSIYIYIIYERFPLASDSNFREDLIAWKLNDFDLAMKMKTKMEEAQRADAKLRKKK